MPKYGSWPTSNQGSIVGARLANEIATRFTGLMSVLSSPDQRDAAITELLADTAAVGTINVKSFGAIGDGTTDDTAAINSALVAGASGNATVWIPSGTYKVVPASAGTDEGGAIVYAFDILTNMHVLASPGATFKLADDQTTVAVPVRLGMFFSSGITSDWSIAGLTMDMNAANNPINPSAGPFDNSRNQAHISVSGTPGGVAARATNVVIADCKLINTAGTNCIVMAQSNTVSITLGSGWKVLGNLFENNGRNVSDFTAVYGWADDVLLDGNTFQNDTSPVAGDGLLTCYEVHGANHRLVNNLCKKAYRGFWVAPNLSTPCVDIVIDSNTFTDMQAYGIDFDRSAATHSVIANVVISNNTISFNDDSVSVVKTGIQILTPYAVTDVLITGNMGTKTGTSVNSAMVGIGADSTAVSKNNKIAVIGNTAKGFVSGVSVTCDSAVDLGKIIIKDNVFYDLVTAGGSSPTGISVNVTTGDLDNIDISGNRILTATKGINLIGNITILNVYGNSYQNMATATYDESSATITTKTTSGDSLTGAIYDGPGSTLRGTITQNAGSDFARDRANSGTGESRLEIGLTGGFGGFRTWLIDGTERMRISNTGMLTLTGGVLPAVVTFSATDTTPTVALGQVFLTHASTQTLTDFDDGTAGQRITVISKAAVTFAFSGDLTGSSASLVTASGDVTEWICEDGTVWVLTGYVDVSVDNSAGA